MKKKIIDFSNVEKILKPIKRKGKKIVCCHGVFDLLHIGHLKHFKSAKKYGDILIVSVTPDKFVQKGFGRPYFNSEQRMQALSLIGVISGAYGLTQFVLRIPLGVLSDRTQRRKWFVVIGALSGIVSCVGLGISRDPRTFIIWRGMAGIAVTMYVATTALYAAQYDGNNTSRSMGVFMSTISLAAAVGPLLGGWAAAGLGWRSPFLLGAILGVIALVPLCAVRDVPSVSVTVEVPLVSGLASLFRRPAIVKAAVLGAVTAFTQFATTMTFVPIRAAQMGADQMQLGLLLFVTMSIFSLASLASGSVIATRIGDQLTLVLGFVVLAGSAIVAQLVLKG